MLFVQVNQGCWTFTAASTNINCAYIENLLDSHCQIRSNCIDSHHGMSYLRYIFSTAPSTTPRHLPRPPPQDKRPTHPSHTDPLPRQSKRSSLKEVNSSTCTYPSRFQQIRSGRGANQTNFHKLPRAVRDLETPSGSDQLF